LTLVITKFHDGDWENTEIHAYKDNPGSWLNVTRRKFNPEGDSDFEVRYYEVAPGGYTSFERHEHEHLVFVLCGEGEVRLGDDWTPIGPRDVVRVPGMTPHQFKNIGGGPFGFLCVVDRVRDKPVLMETP